MTYTGKGLPIRARSPLLHGILWGLILTAAVVAGIVALLTL